MAAIDDRAPTQGRRLVRRGSRPTAGGCWHRIGVSGDRSCPELSTFVHCRNCPVFAAAARVFFDRPAPEGYLAEWTRLAGRLPTD